MKMALIAAAFGLAMISAAPAFAASNDVPDGSDDSYDVKQTMTMTLLDQFDALAPQHKTDDGYASAMELRRQAGVDFAWERYENATQELREALNRIGVWPNQ